jgi:hypothetical protein
MDDLRLFRLLSERTHDADGLRGLLEELARQSTLVRLPFLGLLVPLLEGGNPGLKAAAIRCLMGCEGAEATRLIAAYLEDDDPEVRGAALDFFRDISRSQPWRWVHVAYHPDARIRRAAFEDGVAVEAASMGFPLLVDEACGELARQRFLPGHPVERWALPRNAPALILEMVSEGILSEDDGRALFLGLKADDLGSLFEQGRARTEEAAQRYLEQARVAIEAPTSDGEPDELERLVDLLWIESPSPAQGKALRDFLGHLAVSSLCQSQEFRRRCAAAITRKIALSGGGPALFLELLVELHPLALTFAWLPREQRREALRVFYRRGDATRKEPPETIESLIEGDLVRHREGGLDLWALGAMLHAAQGSPFELLFRWVRVDPVLDAFVLRPTESMPFLSLSDSSHRGNAFLLKCLRHRMPRKMAWCTASWALSTPVEQLDALVLATKIHEDEEDGEKKEKGARKKRGPKKAPPRPAPGETPTPELISAAEAVEIFRALLEAIRQGYEMPLKRAERLAALLGGRIGSEPAGLGLFLDAWLGGGAEEPPPLGVQILVALANPIPAADFASWLASLDPRRLLLALSALSFCTSLPFAKERALAELLADHPAEPIRAWARSRLPVEEVRPPPPTEGRPLTDKEREVLSISSDANLPATVQALGLRRSGLAPLLLARSPAVSLPVCVALLCCDDPVRDVDRALSVWGSGDPSFLNRLDAAVVEAANALPALPALGHAWLYRWERHAFALLGLLTDGGASLESALSSYLSVVGTPWARTRLIEAVSEILNLLAYRDKERAELLCTVGLLELLIRELTGSAGEAAAGTLVQVRRVPALQPLVASLRPRVLALLPELSAEVRARLSAWIDSTGLAPARAARKVVEATSTVTVEQVRGCRDPDQLAAWTQGVSLPVLEEIALRLLDLAEPGLNRVVDLLLSGRERAQLVPFLALVDLWPDGAALARLRDAVADQGSLPHELRFALALALGPRGDGRTLEAALLAACAPGTSWFSLDDWKALTERFPEKLAIAVRLAASPQPHAYREAVEFLLTHTGRATEEAVKAGLLSFLEAGTARLFSLRFRAAQWLHERGVWQALPVLMRGPTEQGEAGVPDLLWGVSSFLVESFARSILLLGGVQRERGLLAALERASPEARGEALELVIARCQSNDTRRAAVRMLGKFLHRAEKLDKIAETFAWGVHRGRELLGGFYKVEMVEGSALGYTRLQERRIFISPLPILRRERNGRELVEALILHELGHHRYHRGSAADRCWKLSEQEGIQRLYNLVLDEHLERNLRAIDEGFGDRLKLLASYAFQHSNRDVPVQGLLVSLGLQAARVLPRIRLRVARDPGMVTVESGGLLQAMERRGLAFSRFLRALRMGLGNRHQDPRVNEALALFKGGFRHKGPEELLEVARALKKIFGGECTLLECTGSHETLGDGAEAVGNGDGISSQEVDEEVERILDPRKGPRRGAGDEENGKRRLWINVNPDTDFARITSVNKLELDRAAAEALAVQVRRQGFHLRRYLEDLGLARVPERRRIQGHRFDESRVQALLLRNDPRVLIARRVEVHTDVFLGVVVDCSGSMQCSGRIERARLFAALIAEAVRGMKTIDLRLFGFTDQVIYDAGDANACAAHRLAAGGGNNDAAALWHAAQVARQSKRRSQVLVMISDGLPTECSAAALRNLVEQLTRRARMVCAQVAVAPITEPCFPHYVLLNESNQDEAVRRFGALVGALVRRSMQG